MRNYRNRPDFKEKSCEECGEAIPVRWKSGAIKPKGFYEENDLCSPCKRERTYREKMARVRAREVIRVILSPMDLFLSGRNLRGEIK